MTRRDRPLTEADVHIWNRVAKTVKPYEHAKPLPLKAEVKGGFVDWNKGIRATLAPSRTPGQRLRPEIRPQSKRVPAQAPQITADKRTRRGKISIDRRIDLHDQTQEQAYSALATGLYAAHSKGQRCVLVITGKGGLNHKGVLRRMFPIWLADPQIRPLIASYASAHQRHGGAGAWYVFLKR